MDHEKPISPWPEWKIIEKIGEGSYGKVYKAQRTEQGRSFYSALKVIPIPSNRGELNSVRLELGNEESVRAYFKNIVEDCIQEISTMEYFRGNSHIVSVEDFKVVEYLDEVGWDIYIRMEYLQSFLDYCTGRELTEREIIRLGINLCKALEYCGQLRIIHRDIKPENIFVSRFRDFKLGDFGIARELERSMGSMSKKGTFSYMAPEMYRGESYDSSVDIYSLGIVLYKLMNRNRLPFMNLDKQLITYHDKETALNRRMSGELLPKPADASDELSEIILRACAFDVKKRYQDPEMMREDLERLRRGEYIAGSPAKAVGLSGTGQTGTDRTGTWTGTETGAGSRTGAGTWTGTETGAGSRTGTETGAGNRTGTEAGIGSRTGTEAGAERVFSGEDTTGTRSVRGEGTNNPAAAGVNLTSRENEPIFDIPLPEDTFEEGRGFRIPVWAVVSIILAACAIVVAVVWFRREPEEPESVQMVPASQVVNALEVNDNSTAQIDDFSTTIADIKTHATEVVNMLPECRETGSEGTWLHYFDPSSRLIKALLYPDVSETGQYEEYYYWDDKLFFAYIWDDEGDELCYFNAGEAMIRWIDREGTVHDMDRNNPAYEQREKQYSEIARKQLALASKEALELNNELPAASSEEDEESE